MPRYKQGSNAAQRALVWVLFSLIPLAQADTAFWEQQLRAQLDEAELTGHEQFSFTQTLVSRDETKVSSFNPVATPKWQLILIDGKPPSDKEQAKYEKQQAKEAQRREGDTFGDLIKADSIAITSIDSQNVMVSFIPYLKHMADKAEQFMRGEAIFNGADKRLQQVRIYSVEPFSPGLAVQIDAMTMTFEFAEQQGQTLPSTYLFAFQGKLAAVKKIDVESTISYSEYRRINLN